MEELPSAPCAPSLYRRWLAALTSVSSGRAHSEEHT